MEEYKLQLGPFDGGIVKMRELATSIYVRASKDNEVCSWTKCKNRDYAYLYVWDGKGFTYQQEKEVR